MRNIVIGYGRVKSAVSTKTRGVTIRTLSEFMKDIILGIFNSSCRNVRSWYLKTCVGISRFNLHPFLYYMHVIWSLPLVPWLSGYVGLSSWAELILFTSAELQVTFEMHTHNRMSSSHSNFDVHFCSSMDSESLKF